MGRNLYAKEAISSSKTKNLDIPELRVLENEGDDTTFCAVHRRYFKKGKQVCPVCGSDKTRCSKVLKRKFKDILWENNEDFKVIDLYFYQRYFRCDGCGESVFPEDINFGVRGCRYTNRLSEKLADGTLRYSYKKVCDFYKVPASTASVGAIMRRTLKNREDILPQLKTPPILGVFELQFYDRIYPAILAVWDEGVYCIDILEESTEEAYIKFFKKLDRNQVKTIFIDPVESLYNASHACFSSASIVITDECILRCALSAMNQIILADGKRFAITHKYDKLTKLTDQLDKADQKKIIDGLKIRPRLKVAHNAHQELLELMRSEWVYDDVLKWLNEIPEKLPDGSHISFPEFEPVRDLVELFENEINDFAALPIKPTERYASAVKALCDALKEMPYCIYDVLRARMMFTIDQDITAESDSDYRLGIRVDKLTTNLNEISKNIKEEREYGWNQ